MTFDDRKNKDAWNRILGAMMTLSNARNELAEAGITDQDIVARLRDTSTETASGLTAITKEFMKSLGIDIDSVMEHQNQDYRQPFIYDVIQRLFREHPSPLPDQAPAIECAVMFHSGASVQGALSEATGGGLRMLTNPDPNQRAQRGKLRMIETYFDYSDIVSVGIQREVEIVAPKIAS